jgi:chromosomal replication initiator protein
LIFPLKSSIISTCNNYTSFAYVIVMTTKNKIWDQVVDTLRSKISPFEINTWFANTTCSILDNNVVVIDVPNKFIANWLKDNYFKDIYVSLKNILRENPEVNFRYLKRDHHSVSKRPQKQHHTKRISIDNNLNRSMGFHNYIVSDFNRFACSSAMEVSNNPGGHYNPFYIFSRKCTGKTHLLNAVGNHIANTKQGVNIYYTSSRSFISEYEDMLTNNNLNIFKHKYLNLDILLFDDIQYLINKSRLQEEFLYIFKHIYGLGKQIIITGDRHPDMLRLNVELKSRLGSGLLAELGDFDYKAKYNIIKTKTKEYKLKIPKDIIYLLIRSTNNIKTILKNILRIERYLQLNNDNINISLVNLMINNNIDNTNIGIKEIQSVTARYFDISTSDIVSNKRNKPYAYPRQLAMYLSRKYTNLSFQEIGYRFGKRDHSTVIYALKKINKIKKLKKEVKVDLNNIETLLV